MTDSFKSPIFKAPPVRIRTKKFFTDIEPGKQQEVLGKLDELIAVIREDNKLEQEQLKLDKRESQEKKRVQRENKIEGRKFLKGVGTKLNKTLFGSGGLQDIFDKIIKFFLFTGLGQLVKVIGNFLKDPKNQQLIGDIQTFFKEIPGKIESVVEWANATVTSIKDFAEDFRQLLIKFPFLGDALRTEEEKEAERQRIEERDKKIEEELQRGGGFFTTISGGGMLPFLGTDTVPAMLTPGEFVMSRGAVNKFGIDFMESINAMGGGTNRPKLYGFSGGGIVPMTDTQRRALEVLAKYESKGTGDYNAVNQYGDKGGRGNKYVFPDGSTTYAGDYRNAPFNTSGKPLTDLTVKQVLDLQYDNGSLTMRQWADRGKLHAVGRYQFIGNTLPGLVERSGVPLTAKYDKKAQDILALQLIKERGIYPWVGPTDKATASERSIVEASRKDPIPTYTSNTKKPKPPVMPAGGSMMGPAFGDDSTAYIQSGRTELEKLGRFIFDKTGARDLFQMIQDKLPVGTPNMPVSNEVIVLPTIKADANATTPPPTPQIPEFEIASNVQMRGLVGKALGIDDLVGA